MSNFSVVIVHYYSALQNATRKIDMEISAFVGLQSHHQDRLEYLPTVLLENSVKDRVDVSQISIEVEDAASISSRERCAVMSASFFSSS